MQTLLIPLLALGLGLLFNELFYGQWLGLSALIFVAGVLAAVLIAAAAARRKLPAAIGWPVALLTFFATMIFVRASLTLTFWNAVLCLLLLTILVATSRGRPVLPGSLVTFFGTGLSFLGWFGPGLKALAQGLTFARRPGQREVAGRVIFGVLIALPFLILFGLLFAMADPIFADYLQKVLHLSFEPATYFQILLVVVVTLLSAGALSLMAEETQPDQQPAETLRPAAKPGLGEIETITILALVDLLFLGFVIVQFAYLFNGSSQIGTHGLTYAEYAQRGVSELVMVALVTFLLLVTAEASRLPNQEKNFQKAYRFVATALLVGVAVVIASASYRLSLYETAYGLTTARFYSHAFIIWLAGLFLLLLGRLYFAKIGRRFGQLVAASVLIVYGLLNLANPDALIARANMTQFGATDKLDLEYLLFDLSEDAIPVVVGLLDQGDEIFRRSLAKQLALRLEQEEHRTTPIGWQEFHWGRYQAIQALTGRRAYLEENRNYASPNQSPTPFVCVVPDEASALGGVLSVDPSQDNRPCESGFVPVRTTSGRPTPKPS